MRIYHADNDTSENIWSLIDAIKNDPGFWRKFPIDLQQSQIADQMRQQSVL